MNMDDIPKDPIEETPEETLDYNEVHNKSAQELSETPEEIVEEPKEEIKEEPKEEAPVEEPKVDPAKMADEIAKKVTENLMPENKETAKEEAKDKYEEFFNKVKTEKGREPNWKEVSKFIQEQTLESIKQERLEEQKIQEERKEQENKVTKELSDRFNATLDEELQEMYDKGELTPIKDKNNPSDQGVIERQSLFAKMLEVNKQREAEGKPIIMSISRIKYGYWTKPSAQPAGENAPVSMGRGSASVGEESQEIDYVKDVQGKKWSSFMPKIG